MSEQPNEHWIQRAEPGEQLKFTGERFVPSLRGEIESEHVHRYLFAATLCAGKRVLDIACGEGFGSAMLAQVADEVVGVDIDAATVEHAARSYPGKNLSFEVGSCEKIPGKRDGFDVVVSFETIEHIEDHAGFVREVRRVLRPGGLFVCSTPDKAVYLAGEAKNPFHLKELTADEFGKFLGRRFENTAMFGQRLASGSVIARGGNGRTEIVRTVDGKRYDRGPAEAGATYLIAVCSDARLPRLNDQVLSDGRYSIGRVTHLSQTCSRLETELGELGRKLAGANARVAQVDSAINQITDERDRSVASRDQAVAERSKLAEDRGRLIAEREAAQAERDAAIRDAAAAQVDYERAAAELARVREEMTEAREKAAAAQATLAATKNEVATLRQATADAVSGRDTALGAQKQAEIHAARVEERSRREQGELEGLRRQLVRSESTAGVLRDELAWLRSTRSWRWTGAMRVVSAAGRATAVRGLGLGVRLGQALNLPGIGRMVVARRASMFRGSRLFNASYYLRTNPDVAAAGMDPAWHFAARGGNERRRPSEAFDTGWYLDANPDVAAAGVHPFEHYITMGMLEGRAALPPQVGPDASVATAANTSSNQTAINTAQVKIQVTETPSVPEVQADVEQLKKTKVLAFYLPQFHPIPENDAWWGKGFTEWANVTRARPMFPGHAQPVLPGELGFYDLRLAEVRERQADLARAAGIHGFCYHHYWFNGRRVLERPLEDLLNSGGPDFPFCVSWANENWTRRWDGLEQEILLRQDHTLAGDRRFILDLLPYLEDNRYVRVDGRPVVLVYRADLMANAADTAAVWRDECRRAGLGDIHLCAVQFRTSDPRPLGFDAAVEFPPHHFPAPEITGRIDGLDPMFGGTVYDYASGVREMIVRPRKAGYRLYRGVMPSWDNTARRMEEGIIHKGATPELYASWLASAINQPQPEDGVRENLVFVNAWNEWAEGTVLEPRKDLGDAYLRATAGVLLRATAPARGAERLVIETNPATGIAASPVAMETAAVSTSVVGESIEDRLKRVVRTTPALNSFLNRHPSIKNRAAVLVRRAADRSPKDAGNPLNDQQRPLTGAEQGSQSGGIDAGSLWRAGSKERHTPDAKPILIVSHDACLAGAQIVVLELLRHLSKVPSVRVYHLLCGSGALEPEFRTLATTLCIDDLTRRGLGRERAIAAALDALPEVSGALCNTAAVPDAVRACKQRGMHTVAYLHELPTTIDSMLGGEKTVRTIDRHADEIVVVSDFVRDRLCERYGLPADRLRVTHMGVFPSKDSTLTRRDAKATVASELGVDASVPLVLGCGTIHHRKGTDLWVRAAARVVRIARESGGPIPLFVWVGWDQSGPEMRSWCEHDARAAGIADRVRFLGQRQDTQRYFAAADVFALSSREDPFPLVSIEALACGTPVVAFDGAGGAPEVLRETVPGTPAAGIVVRYGDAEAMGEAISVLLNDEGMHEEMSASARRVAREQLSWDRYIGSLFASLMPTAAPVTEGPGSL